MEQYHKHKLGPAFGSILGSIFGYTQSDDPANGLTLLTSYFNEATNYPDNFSYDNVQDFITAISTQLNEDFQSFVGQTYRLAQSAISLSQAQAQMVALADSTQGAANPSQITQAAGAIGAAANQVNLSQAIPTVTGQTAETVATQAANVAANVGTAVESVGQGVIASVNMLQYLPYILLGAGALVLYVWSKTTASEVGGAIKAAGEGVKAVSGAASDTIKSYSHKSNPRRKRRHARS